MDWNNEIRSALKRHPAGANLSATEQADVVEEWAQHAEAAWASARADGLTESDAKARVQTQIDSWCANLAAAPRRRSVPFSIQPPSASTRGITGLWQDVRYGWRVLLKQPGFAFVAVATTALAIGATTTLFTVADGVLTRPLPFPDADRLDPAERNERGRDAPTAVAHHASDLSNVARQVGHD